LKVSIYFEEEYLGVYPSIINAITLFSPKCSRIDIMSAKRKSTFPEPPMFPQNVFFHKVRQDFIYDRNQFKAIPPSSSSGPNKKMNSLFWKAFLPELLKVEYRKTRDILVHNIEFIAAQYAWFKDKVKYYIFCLNKSSHNKPEILIAVDNSGMIAACIVSLFSKVKPTLIFWSLEIDTGTSPLFLKRLHDWFFSKCIRFSNVLVIQEKPRLELLREKLKTNFRFLDIFFIPHSPIGESTFSNQKVVVDNNYFRKKFCLDRSEKIILHAGWIHDAMCVDKIAESSKSWDSSYKLVLHERERRSPHEPFIRHVSSLSDKRALLSLNPVSFDRIDEVFSSADIGIIAYDKKYGGGRENAHKASGKLGQYLKCGVPVIALDLPGYSEMFDRYQCGMVFQDFASIEKCIDAILENYTHFHQEALRCFREEFDFKKFFQPLLSHACSTSTINSV
jgi:glycosyltransferase involved in cell wall biosynthesis